VVTKKDILKIINDNREQIKNFGIRRIGIFGSFIRVTQKMNSDIDILVEFKEGEKTFNNYIDLKFFLQKLFNRKVDLVIKDVLKPRVKPYIIKEVKYARL